MWIFGYGSLVWRPALPWVERQPSFITGWSRRFWQGSPDHRGVPDAPGRVVTLIEAAGERCVGIAYRVAESDWESVLIGLDLREQGGYQQVRLPLHRLDGGGAVEGLVYVAGKDNPHYLGPAPLATIARQVLASRGPSGENREYVLRLHAALVALDSVDEHVAELAALVAAESVDVLER